MKKNKILIVVATLLAGIAIGWILFHSESNTTANQQATQNPKQAMANNNTTLYTCAMHPQIRQHKPGNCPICGMELIPVKQASAVINNNKMVEMSADAIALANIQTTTVKTAGSSTNRIYLTGKIMVDQRNIYTPTAQFDGRIEKLYVNFTGQYVSKGEVLASIYSPDLISAEQELLVAVPYKNTNPEMYKAARNKLKYWQIANQEIDKIEKNGKIVESLPIQAARSGVVMKLNVAVGDRIKTGDVLYEIANLNHLWVMMDAYQQDLGLIKKGDIIQFTVPSMPDKVYKAQVTYIDPYIDPQTRIAKVRAEVNNPKGELKPEMFVRGTVDANVSIPGGLLIPQSAVLWTGKRSLVYVKVPDTKEPTFEYREVTLGPEAGDDYVITDGLKKGEEVATNGTFTIDAAAQLSGKASMMEPNGGISGSMPGMKMGGGKASKSMGAQQGSGANDLKEQAGAVGKLLGEGCPVFSKSSRKAFYPAMQKLTPAYLAMKNDLVKEDASASDKAAAKLKQLLKQADDKGLSKRAHVFLSKQKELLTDYLNQHLKANDLKQKKANFTEVSKIMIRLENAFGSNRKLYLTYCPMANNKKGAYWISEYRNIKNPFMPKQMQSCGEVKYVINNGNSK